jgi:glucose/arabinose dehydrogenase
MLALAVGVLALGLMAAALGDDASRREPEKNRANAQHAGATERRKAPAPEAQGSPTPRLRPVADGVPQPTNVTFDRRGRLWITSSGYKPAAGDGVWFVPRPGASPVHVVSDLPTALGLLWHRGTLFVSHLLPGRDVGQVSAFSGFDGRRFARRRVVVDDIPTGRHTVDSLAARSDGRIFLGVGSQTDAGPPTRRLSASVISFRADGSDVTVEGRGLRNPYGLAFLPDGRTLVLSDQGRDDLGLDEPPEELNVLNTAGRAVDFGHPRCYGQGGRTCAGSRRARVRMPAHSAAAGVAVAERFGTLGPSVFVALYGSTFDKPPTGGEIVRIPLRGGRPARNALRFAPDVGAQEPLGLAMGPDKRLYVTLHKSGRVVAIEPPGHADTRE